MSNESRNIWWPLIPTRSERRGFLLLGVFVLLWLSVSWMSSSSVPNMKHRSQSPATSYPRLNEASAGRIEEIPGIGLKRAKQIVNYRRRNGPIDSMGELKEVSGIGPETIRKLRTYGRLEPVRGD